MKIGIHFNCQNDGLAVSLRALLPNAEVIAYHTDASLPAAVQAERAARLNACDHVITGHIDARHGLLSAASLRASARSCHILPGFAFAGFHPDMCYIQNGGQVLVSATGDYHSRIAVAGYLAGLDARDTVALYNGLVFARLGYFAAFAEQAALLTDLWARDGVDAHPLLARWAASGCFAYSINHPKMIVLLDLARIACDRMGLTPEVQDIDPAALPDLLGRGPRHPVFPEIAVNLGVPPEGCFSPGHTADGLIVMPPVDFVSDSFGRYAHVPVEALRATAGVDAALDALGLEVRAPAPRRHGKATMLLTHHGTLLRAGPMRGQVSHAPLNVAEWEAAPLRADAATLPARQDGAGLEGAAIEAASDPGRVQIGRGGAFLRADAHGGTAGFASPSAGPRERFLPVSGEEVALLQRLLAADWFVVDTHAIVSKAEIAIEPGPLLRFGAWRIDLARHLPRADGDLVHLILGGARHRVRERAQASGRAALPDPGKTLGLVGTPVFVTPPLVADAADLAWMRRSAVAAMALDGAPQATQALLRRETDAAIASPAAASGGLALRFCGLEAGRASGWAEAAVRLHVLAAVAPEDSTFLVPAGLPEEALPAWRALGFGGLRFSETPSDAGVADLVWLDNAAIAELPGDALAGCRARIGIQGAARQKLFWRDGVSPIAAGPLAELGFEAVEDASLPIVRGVALAAHAGWMVGRTGRMPLVFCQPGTLVVELCDEAGFVQDDWVLSSKLGLRHAILPCPARDGYLRPDPDKLARLLG